MTNEKRWRIHEQTCETPHRKITKVAKFTIMWLCDFYNVLWHTQIILNRKGIFHQKENMGIAFSRWPLVTFVLSTLEPLRTLCFSCDLITCNVKKKKMIREILWKWPQIDSIKKWDGAANSPLQSYGLVGSNKPKNQCMLLRSGVI